MDTRRLFRISATALVAAGLLLSGCSSDSASGAGTGAGSTADPAALKKFYGQKLAWRSCGVTGFECAKMKAPLDYTKPDGTEISLAVARKKATGPGTRLGSLQVNPGGPGGSAVGYLQAYAGIGYPAPVRARYDMVAIDPRGVADSEPVECLTGKEMDAYTQVDQTPDDQGEETLLTASFKKFAAGCEKRSATILPHVSTVDAARDMDVFRAALGDKKLTYVGASYGTFLGATYAELFPKHTGRLRPRRRDGPVPPGPRAEPRPDRRLRDGLRLLRGGLRQADGLPARHEVRRGRRRTDEGVLQHPGRQARGHGREPP